VDLSVHMHFKKPDIVQIIVKFAFRGLGIVPEKFEDFNCLR